MESETSTYGLLHLCIWHNAESSAGHLWLCSQFWISFEQWLPVYQLWVLPRLSSCILFIVNARTYMKYNSKCRITRFCGLECCIRWSGWWRWTGGARLCCRTHWPHTGKQWVSLAGQGTCPPWALSGLPSFSFPSPISMQRGHNAFVESSREALVKGGGARFLYGKGDLIHGKFRCCG